MLGRGALIGGGGSRYGGTGDKGEWEVGGGCKREGGREGGRGRERGGRQAGRQTDRHTHGHSVSSRASQGMRGSQAKHTAKEHTPPIPYLGSYGR